MQATLTHGQTLSSLRGGLMTRERRVVGRASRAQKMPARQSLVREQMVPESQVTDDMPGLLPPTLQNREIVAGK